MLALRLIVQGIVQGVGFRPFIHRSAIAAKVKGYVRNVGGSEVEIFIEGPEKSVMEFLQILIKEKPPPALIEEIEIHEELPKGLKEFMILRSSTKAVKRSMIPPDFAICEYCLKEVLDERNRRFRYAFNSCAWCGPRYSMMYSAPYDRENTAMRKYPLCQDCMAEYTDVHDLRRYHAQGISCPIDGPKLWLTHRNGERIVVNDPIKEAAKLIDEGAIVAVKGLGGYHIAALATDDDVVLKLRQRKNRPTKPFAIMGLDLQTLKKIVDVRKEHEEILTSPERPIVLIPKLEGSPVSRHVSPGMDVEGVFTPYTALHYLLIMETRDRFLIMTSGNPRGKPMCTDEACAYGTLSKYVDYFLVHDREIVNRVDDSVIRFTDGEPVLLRRARGYAPKWIRLKKQLKKDVIALGAELQSAGAVGFEDKVVLTQYIGDLEEVDALQDLDKYLRYFIKNYRVNTRNAVIVVDKHPSYSSRGLGLAYAEKWGTEVMEVQHHYAHALSAAADRGILGKPFVAIVVDGVGYGDDGAIWGGEVIRVDRDLRYSRIAHLEYLPLVGDESVIRPARFLTTVLLKLMPPEEVKEVMEKTGAINGLKGGEAEITILSAAVKHGRYVETSSTGRVLDAISALLGVRLVRTYEGEPAISLEAFSRGGQPIDEIIESFTLTPTEDGCMISVSEVFRKIVENLPSDIYSKKSVAVSVQYGLGRGLGKAALKAIERWREEVEHVVISGGAAVNDYIVKGIKEALADSEVDVLLPRNVPANDGGIALGQVASVLGVFDE